MSEDSVAHAIIEKDTLQDYIETVHCLVDEAKIHFSDNGFHASAVDPANVGMCDYVDLAPRAFEAYDAPGAATIGVNLERFLDYISPARAGQLVELNLNMESRMLDIRYGPTSHTMALIDPDAIRSEPDTADVDLPNTVVLEGGDFRHAIDMAALSSDHIYVRGDVEERHVEFYCQADTDESTVIYGDEEVIDAAVNETVESVYSVDYLEDMTDPIPNGAEVTVLFGNEFPIRFRYDIHGGALDVQMTLAPRIQSS